MARVGRASPARLGPARAAVARPERRPRRLRARARQHPRPRQPLVQARASSGCSSATARWSRPARRSRGRCCSCGSDDAAGEHDRRSGAAGRDRNAAATATARRRTESQRRTPRARASSRSGSRPPASSRSPTWRSRATSLDPASYSRISLCWAIMFVILSVIYRPIEQLLSRTIADRRARGLHGHPLRIPAADPGRLRDAVPGRRAGAATTDRARDVRRLERPVLDPRDRRARVRGELLRPRLAGRPPAVRAVRRARVPRVDLALPVRARGRGRDRLGSGRRSGSGWRSRRSRRCA